MTLEQLRIFVAVAERQHVTQAAQTLNLAQSAASHAIAALEERHDIKLFDRVGRRIELTDAGQAFLGEARTILAQVSHAELVLGEFGKLERGILSVHASQTIASYWLPRYLGAFRRAYAHIEIKLQIANTAQVAEAIEGGIAELGFIEGIVESESLVSTPIARDRLVLVVGPEHPWAVAKKVSAADLHGSEWVLRERGSGTRAAFERALAALNIDLHDLRVTMELPSNEAVRAAVEAGIGATAISASVAASSIEAGLLEPIDFTLPDRSFFVLRHAQRHQGRAARALLSIIDRQRIDR